MERKPNKRNKVLFNPAKLLSATRQLAFPKEFRIGPTVWPPDLIGILERLTQQLEAKPESSAQDIGAHKEEMRFLADVGTGLWRLRQKMVQPGTNEPFEEMRRAYRHFESIWDALAQAGVEIRDHTGESVPEGGVYALKTIAFQPTPGIDHEKVIETIKPTVYYRNQMIQMGEVIVGTPETPDAAQSDHKA